MGSLEGRIITPDSLPLTDAQIEISGPALQGSRNVFSDSRGYFRAVGLPAGSYTVRISRFGYRGVVIEDLQVLLGKTVTLGLIELQIRAIEIDPIVVSARPAVIDPYSTSVGANLETTTIREVPVEREYQSLLVVLAHANTSFYGDKVNIGGSTGLENMYYVDGVNVTSLYTGASGTRLPYNFIKEIDVREGGYEARYGGALGGIVNVITHSGSNNWEVDAFGYFTNSSFAAEKRPGLQDLPERGFASYDLGGRISGPILRDRLWFSAAYNPLVAKRDVEALNQGFFEDRRTEHRFAAKVNWRATERTDVEVSVFGDPTTQHHVSPPPAVTFGIERLANPDPFLWLGEEGGVAVSLRARRGLGRRAVLEASVSRYDGDENNRAERQPPDPFYQDFLTSTAEGGYPSTEYLRLGRTSADVRAMLPLGRHTLTIGGGYQDNRIEFSTRLNGPVGMVWKLDESLYATYLESSEGVGRNRVPTVYAQDAWRLNDRFTINAGVRWDGQFFYGAGDTLAQEFTKQWQPRVGFTLQLGELGTQKLFGSYGRYYQQQALFFTMLAHSGLRIRMGYYGADPRDPTVPPDLVIETTELRDKVEGADGDHFDEFTLGYERVVGRNLKLLARGIYRALLASFGVGIDPQAEGFSTVVGNLGRGDLNFLPSPERRYTALELAAEYGGYGPLYFRGSYVLSRTEGNYTGLYSSDVQRATPGNNWTLRCEEQGKNSTGLLPNDRTHALKLLGSYRVSFGLSIGTFFTWQSGSPLNEFGPSQCLGVFSPVFLIPRGSAGRTPSIWDLNVRLSYPLGPWGGVTSRLVLDVLHIGSQREVVVVDQLRLLEGGAENPTFGAALVNQAPMMVRLGLEVGF